MAETECGGKTQKDTQTKNGPHGFEKGLEPHKIIKAKQFSSGLQLYLMEWKMGNARGDSKKETDWITSIEAKIRCPHLVIDFLEGQLIWTESHKKYEGTGFSRGLTPEKILGQTDISKGKMFLITWEGSDECSIVPYEEALLNCKRLVVKFYASLYVKNNFAEDARDRFFEDGRRKFEQDYEADKILGMTKIFRELMYVVKWKYAKGKDLMLASEAKRKCPQVVIDFYESHLEWRKEETSTKNF